MILWLMMLWADTGHVLELAVRLAARAGIELTYRDGRLALEDTQLSRLRTRVRLQLLNPCARAKSFSVCFGSLDARIGLGMAGWRPRILEVGPITARSGSVEAREPGEQASQGAAPAAKGTPFPKAPAWLAGARVFPIEIEVERARYVPRKGAAFEGRARLRSLPDPKGPAALEVEASVRRGRVSGRAYARIGTIGESGISARITASARNLVAGLRLARVDDCLLRLENKTGARLAIDCPVRASVPLPARAMREFGVPAELGARVSGELRGSRFPPEKGDVVSGKLRARLDPVTTPLLQGEVEVNARVAGRPAEFPRGWKLETALDAKAEIPRFERLVALLARSRWPVPAPFHVLRGTVDARAAGNVELAKARIPVTLRTRLRSSGQRLDLDAAGSIGLLGARTPSVELDVQLSDLKLQLPRLDFAEPPQLLPDDRFRAGPPEPEGPPGFLYRLRLRTPPSKSALVVSNLAQKPIPLELDVRLASDGPAQGSIAIGRVPVEAFRRKAIFDHLVLELASPVEDSRIDGKILVPYADYTVTVLLLGTEGKPRVALSSDPPLPESQLVATLLFGQPLDTLDSEQRSSVGNTQAAFTEGAVGLASFWALASTPIQSIGYDPRTGKLSAKVRLAEGTSLNIGGSAGNEDIGIRKRLGPHWTLATDLGRSTTGENGVNTASAYLEWTLRY